ncbi:MAG: hypothetical protein ACTSQI_20985 [Candidatus Helarchaeota archaeon]
MAESDQSVDYEGFKGAGGPNAPPPQKPGTNPTRKRLILLVLSPIVVIIVLIVFSSLFAAQGILFAHIIGALWAGFTIAIYDWIIESYAYVKGLWFCYGGYQKIGIIDFKHVPIDMVLGFIGTGFSLTIISYFPQLFRFWGWTFPLLSNFSLDFIGVIVLLVVMSLFGAFADFRSKRSGIWMNGPTWSYWKCAFYAWLPLLSSGIIIDRLILLTWKIPTLLTLILTAPFLVETVIIIYLIKKVL